MIKQLAAVIGAVASASFVDAFVYTSSRSACALRASIADVEPSIAEKCYDAFNIRETGDVTACFASDFSYDDGQYLGVIDKKTDLERYFDTIAKVLPRGAVVVVDHVAIVSDKVATQWHMEKDGSTVPFTRGCSFYTLEKGSGLIKTAFKVSEMIVKPSSLFSDAVVSSAKQMIQFTEVFSRSSTIYADAEVPKTEPLSIIEAYFDAWNRRDIEAALECFIDDCNYETEDPVFVGSYRGKDALRKHLLRNVDVLPSACRIALDDVVVDKGRCTAGVKWHLEANGVSIPNLRGCSMYTIDSESGLLCTGLDITESPVKVPGAIQEVIAASPLTKLMF